MVGYRRGTRRPGRCDPAVIIPSLFATARLRTGSRGLPTIRRGINRYERENRPNGRVVRRVASVRGDPRMEPRDEPTPPPARCEAGVDESAGEPTHRPDSVRGRASRLDPEQPSILAPRCRGTHATYPQTRAGRPLVAEATSSAQAMRPKPRRPSWSCSRWGLPSRPGRPKRWWSLTPPFHPYPHPDRSRGRWRSVSVALSRELPRVGVAHHLALRSPDLPQPVS